MKSAVTISLVPEVRGGPFVFWDDLEAGCRHAAELGFDGIEVFPPGPEAVNPTGLRVLLHDNGLSLAAVGTGAGWVKHKLALTSPEPAIRDKAKAFVRGVIDLAGPFGAPAIIGSMQGRWGEPVSRAEAGKWLADALAELGEHAQQYGTPLLYEHLNRYETNMCNTVAQAAAFVVGLANVRLLADLFHMNIEETYLAAAVREGGSLIGHVHFADSNRRAVGMGHTDVAPVIAALREIGYAGYLSAEVLAWPDPVAAARQTMAAFRKYAL